MRDVDGLSLVLSVDDMTEMTRVFLGDYADARKVEQSTERSIGRLQRYGFLTERKNGDYQVRPVLRSKIDADELSYIKGKLERHIGIDEDDDE